MQKQITIPTCLALLLPLLTSAQQQSNAMSAAYWNIWNPEVQAEIDKRIDKHRKADAELVIPAATANTEVTVKQLTHDFIFGAHIFNFDQLGTAERNSKYKELYGTLFNSATIAFYWKKHELEHGKPRFAAEERDTEEYWNKSTDPKNETHWRRPASDPVVEFCEQRGIRMHGHPMIWGNRRWHHPEWLYENFMPANEKAKLQEALKQDKFKDMTPQQVAEMLPVYTREMTRLFDKRIVDLIEHYQGRIHSWDIVNESATDFSQNRMIPGNTICKSVYGIMPGDYTWRAFQLTQKLMPPNVLLNINDYLNTEAYTRQVVDLRGRGCRIDIMGTQMHLFDVKACLELAEGKNVGNPINSAQQIWDTMAIFAKAGLPLHLSEITITSPGDDERGREIQAILARNLYRAWFSVEQMMGITWWNVVDDCGAPGEPSVSGLFTRNMEPKPSYYALNNLINNEWKTTLTLKADDKGKISFRGFRGKYQAIWKDNSGTGHIHEFHVK